jgi:hypothetical protein
MLNNVEIQDVGKTGRGRFAKRSQHGIMKILPHYLPTGFEETKEESQSIQRVSRLGFESGTCRIQTRLFTDLTNLVRINISTKGNLINTCI